MKIGTKSVLFGAHCFFLHPWFVAAAWTRLYGFPWDPRLWACFFVHDIGYLGKDKMDDDAGETHPEVGANLIRKLFGDEWGDFCLLHSRYYAKRLDRPFSRLCLADKLQFAMFPRGLYLRMTRATGELTEYLENASVTKNQQHENRFHYADYRGREVEWFDNLSRYMIKWVAAHRKGQTDTWTTKRHAVSPVSSVACGYCHKPITATGTGHPAYGALHIGCYHELFIPVCLSVRKPSTLRYKAKKA